MSTTNAPTTTPDAVREAWRHANVRPLWENPLAHNVKKGAPKPLLWKWSVLRPLIADAMTITSMAAVERRVLTLIDPEAQGTAAGTTTNLTAALQILMPGEAARPHRHSMNALRFVIDGNGASTRVDGRDCPMHQGDLVITPGWTWHEHRHDGNAPIVWLDALDAPLHRHLGTDAFEPGPPHGVPDYAGDTAFAVPNMVPEVADEAALFSPVFRYPWEPAAHAVASAPVWRDGTRRVRYANPRTGGPVMTLLDCYLVQIDPGAETVPFRTTSNAVCCVVEGSGVSRIGEDTLSWGPKDIFSLPHGNWITHRSEDSAKLFMVTDRDVLRRLDLLKEECGNANGA
jgi:gentisate 1,2-dioxygenase